MDELKKRKIGFYALSAKQFRTEVVFDPILYKSIFEHILAKSKKERIAEFGDGNRFHFLRSFSFSNSTGKAVFTSAKYNSRPNLVDRNTADERDNPKAL